MRLPPSQSPELAACSLTNWLPRFEKITIATVTIPLPADVLAYLREETIVLPVECDVGRSDTAFESSAAPSNEAPFRPPHTPDDSDHSDDDSDDDDDDNDAPPPSFPAFSARLRDALRHLGAGGAFVKTNWHSAQDARWIMAGQQLRCTELSDVYQLLKASSLCKRDLDVDAAVAEPAVHLRRWRDIHPGTEFRCYVRERRLLAVTPRDWPQYHAYMAEQEADIRGDIRTLFAEHIKERFELDECEYNSWDAIISWSS